MIMTMMMIIMMMMIMMMMMTKMMMMMIIMIMIVTMMPPITDRLRKQAKTRAVKLVSISIVSRIVNIIGVAIAVIGVLFFAYSKHKDNIIHK